ncbi:MAG: succinyl-diaminopimelate desuccinylase [Deltaproteobacteria bacterium]|nr:succinyl-diaminopimelate desuccinylase [Deltaproteobacteria bacterium]
MTLVERLLELCSIPSPTGQEAALSDAIAAQIGRERPDLAIRRHGSSLVIPIRAGASTHHVVLAGHLDTVRSEQDGPVRLEGDQLFGCGASDMKSGLAMMLEIASRPGPGQLGLTLVFYAGEEGPYAGNELERVLCDDELVRGASFAVCLEPSDNELQLGCAGTLHARLTFEGRSAHSARPWQGDNAIHKASALLAEIAAIEPRWTEIDGLRFATVTSVTMASGGMGRNVVPPRFEMNVNHRFAPGTTIAQATAAIESLVAGRAQVEIVDAAPSALPHRDHPLVQSLCECGVKGVSAKQAWTDVARFSQHGVPAVNFGPGVQAQAHQRNEWASVRQLEEGMGVLRKWLSCCP